MDVRSYISLNHPDELSCCEGITARTPVEVYNRLGLAAVSYRIGTHARFKQSMLARLSDAGLPALSGLNTRDDDDFSVALLDAWATVADVLTFYSERIANESYLRTAAERVSLVHLARLIGYELRPGVAAGAYLAFDAEDAPGSPPTVAIDKGTKVQSLPGQDELPQTFETVERIEARPEWNSLRPRPTETTKLRMGSTEIYLKGVETGLAPGDGLLFVGSERERDPGNENWDFRQVKTVTPDPTAGRTKVTWERGLGWKRFGRIIRPAENPTVCAFRQRAALFGHNAPDWRIMPDNVKRAYLLGERSQDPREWPGFGIPSADAVDLDAVYPQVLPGSWLVLATANYQEVYQVRSAVEVSRADFALSARTTRLALQGENLNRFSERLREVTVFAQPEGLEIAEAPISHAVAGASVVLDRRVEGLFPGRQLIVSGQDSESGEPTGEVVTLRRSEPVGDSTRFHFERDLLHAYRRESVEIKANVARATHGETRSDVLGSGDRSLSYQHFTLNDSPLTHTGAPTPSGTESTLEIRVDDVEWREVPTLYGHGPDDRVFVTRTDEAGRTIVWFGDGRTGARLPTGEENVRATYRKGTGLDGMVGAGQLSLLMTRPLGLRGVTNPLPIAGAADPESQDEVRRNAPLTVLTLDRAVSLRDYEDFARAYAGVAKALAIEIWVGEARGVLVTVAGPNGLPVGEDLRHNLREAMRGAGDPYLPLRVEEYREALFRVAAKVEVEADHIPERVLVAVAGSLRERFGFEARSFGQGVELSEVFVAVQDVPGVVAVDIDELYREDEKDSGSVEKILRLRLETAVPSTGEFAAELLVLDPGPFGLDLGMMP